MKQKPVNKFIAGNNSSTMNTFDKTGIIIGGQRFVSPKEAIGLVEDSVFIDLRPDYETVGKRLKVKTIVYIHWKEFGQEYSILDKQRSFIVFDEVGLHSKEIVKFMLNQGFRHVAGLIGGIMDWERDGLPMEINPLELYTGSCACTLKPKKRFVKE